MLEARRDQQQPADEATDDDDDDDERAGPEDENAEDSDDDLEDNQNVGGRIQAGVVGRDPRLNVHIKMDTLFAKGVFKVGDEWHFRFSFDTPNGRVLVDKDGIVSSSASYSYVSKTISELLNRSLDLATFTPVSIAIRISGMRQVKPRPREPAKDRT